MTTLPDPDEPLLTDDGRVIAAVGHKSFATNTTNSTQTIKLLSQTRRKFAEYNATPKELATYSALLVFTAIGIPDNDIAAALKTTITQLARLRAHPTYAELEEGVLIAARESDNTGVMKDLGMAERAAAATVVELMQCPDPKIAFAAAKDVLDRRGHKVAEKIDIRANMLNTFRIELVDRRGSAPVIDMELESDGSSS